MDAIDINNNTLQDSNKTIYSFTLQHKKKVVYDKATTSFLIDPAKNGQLIFDYGGSNFNFCGLYNTSELFNKIRDELRIIVKLDDIFD